MEIVPTPNEFWDRHNDNIRKEVVDVIQLYFDDIAFNSKRGEYTEIYDFCSSNNSDFDDIVELLVLNGWDLVVLSIPENGCMNDKCDKSTCNRTFKIKCKYTSKKRRYEPGEHFNKLN